MQSLLIKDTTRAQREQIVAESLGNISGMCDGCAAGVAEMYRDYIDGKREIRDINMEYRARYVSGMQVLNVTRVHGGQAMRGVYLKSYDLSFKLYVE